jgi:protein-tyrosine phosphatase
MAGIFGDFAVITDKLIVGSRPRNANDIVTLRDTEDVRAIENLEQSSEDLSDFNEKKECDREVIAYERVPIIDETPSSVQTQLPVAVGILAKAIREKADGPGQKVYLHCRAGLGRSPSVAAAYLYWFTNDTLDAACKSLREKRTHSSETPYRDAIRGATYDILRLNNESDNFPKNFSELPLDAFSTIDEDPQKLTIRGYVNQLQEVLNAWL